MVCRLKDCGKCNDEFHQAIDPKQQGAVVKWIAALIDDYLAYDVPIGEGVQTICDIVLAETGRKPPKKLTASGGLGQRMMEFISHFMTLYERVTKEIGNSGKQVPALVTDVSVRALQSKACYVDRHA